MELNTSKPVAQTVQSIDFTKPLTLVVSSSSRYQALVMVLLFFIFTCIFLIGVIWYKASWIGVIFFGLATLYCLKLLLNYWQAGLTPVVQIDATQISIKGVVFDLNNVISFDYKQDLISTLIFNITAIPQDLTFSKFKQKPNGVGVMVLDNENYFRLNIIIYIGRFNILDKKLKPEQMKSLVNEYIEYYKKHNKVAE